jgi:RNA polymerase sigma factor (sigma-70 family)
MAHCYPILRQIRTAAGDSRLCDRPSVSAERDLSDVRRHDDVLLRRFLRARRARDEVAARAAWEELVALNFDRVVLLVRQESRGRLSPEEREDAVQRALTRMLTNLPDTFRGTSIGEWVQATRRLVRFACIDTQRRAARHSARSEPLGDEHDRAAPEPEEDAGPGFLAWAVPRLRGRRREVVELDLQDLSTEEIQERLGASRDVVYAARSRALKDLAKLRDEYEQP